LADRHPRIAQDVTGQHDPLFHDVGNTIFATCVFFDSSLEKNLIALGELGFSLLENFSFPVLWHPGRKIEFKLVILIKHLELQQRRFLDERLRPLRILDSGKLHHNLFEPLPLNQRLGHSELVDSIANRLQGLVDRGILDPFNLAVSELPHHGVRRFD